MTIGPVLVRVLLVLSVLLLPVRGGGADESPALSRGAGAAELGKLELVGLAGEQVSLAPYLGKEPLLLVFWATWCPICRSEVPLLNQINAAALMKVVAIDLEEKAPKVGKFATAHGIKYQVAIDPEGKAARSLQVPGIPYCIIMGRSGDIVYRGSTVPPNPERFLGR